MFVRKSLPGITGIILTFGIVAFAQQPQAQTPPTPPDGTFRPERMTPMRERSKRMGDHRGMGRYGGIGHLMRELNLSDEQRQQMRAIMQRQLEGTKAQREELFQLREKRIAGTFTAEDEARAKSLHQEIRVTMEGVRTEMGGVLTAEQKARLEQLKNERKEKFQLRMKRHQERLNTNPQ